MMAGLRERLEAVPREALVPAGWVLDQLGHRDEGVVDLTVAAAAELLERAPSTIRAWCNEGRLPGAYRLRGREWRIPRAALQSLGERETRVGDGEPVADLGAWRRVAGE